MPGYATPSGAGGAARRPDRRPAQTVRKVLDAGLLELRASSYADLTMRAVASRAGVSAASAYHYFPSKSALVAAIYLDLLQRRVPHTDLNDSTATRVTATMREMVVLSNNNPGLTAACGSALMADDPAVRPLAAQIGAEVYNHIRAALGPGWPPAVTSTLLMAFSGALMNAHFQNFGDVAEQIEQAVKLVLGEPDSARSEPVTQPDT